MPQPTNPTISIALCTYNGACHLPEQLASLRAQHLLPHELVVSDDGSTDNTCALIEAFAAEAPFPVHLHRNPVNLGYARNFVHATSLCTGELIAFADQDDLWYPRKLATLTQHFAEHPETDGLFSDGDLMDGASNPVPGSMWASFAFRPADQITFARGQALDVLLQRNVVTGMAFAIRARARADFAGLPPDWPHDMWLALMLARRAALALIPERLVAYRTHATQQIGVPPISVASKLSWIRGHGLRDFLRQAAMRRARDTAQDARRFRELLAFLNQTTATTDRERDLRRQVQAKIAFLDDCLAILAMPRPTRLRTILRNRRNYLRFTAFGNRAMIRDLVLY